MPPHMAHSSQNGLPLGFEQYSSTRRSGATDHSWKRIPGKIKREPTLLPIWMLIFNSGAEPVRLLLNRFINGHMLVKVLSENPDNHSITYKWYVPDFTQRCA